MKSKKKVFYKVDALNIGVLIHINGMAKHVMYIISTKKNFKLHYSYTKHFYVI